jgi:hypothetical protein
MNTGEILIYQNNEGAIKLDVRLEEETVWLTQAQMALLFNKDKRTISEHISNIFKEGELDQKVVVRNFRITTQHGAVADKTQQVEVNAYNLDVIISVGYRVKSHQGTQFRIWATQRLREYIVKGFALNDERFRSGNSFKEVQKKLAKEESLKEIEEDIKKLKTLLLQKYIPQKLPLNRKLKFRWGWMSPGRPMYSVLVKFLTIKDILKCFAREYPRLASICTYPLLSLVQ